MDKKSIRLNVIERWHKTVKQLAAIQDKLPCAMSVTSWMSDDDFGHVKVKYWDLRDYVPQDELNQMIEQIAKTIPSSNWQVDFKFNGFRQEFEITVLVNPVRDAL